MARPRGAERTDLRAAAIAAAARIAAARGVDALTLRDVATEAGCTAPALYRYFSSKEALLLALHDEGFRILYAEKVAVAVRAGGDAFARLRLGGLAYVRFALEHPALYEVMFNDRGPARAIEAQGGEDHARRSLGFLRASIEACQAEGYLPGIDPDAAAFTFWSAVHGAVALALRRRAPVTEAPPREAAEQAVETMMALVAASRR